MLRDLKVALYQCPGLSPLLFVVALAMALGIAWYLDDQATIQWLGMVAIIDGILVFVLRQRLALREYAKDARFPPYPPGTLVLDYLVMAFITGLFALAMSTSTHDGGAIIAYLQMVLFWSADLVILDDQFGSRQKRRVLFRMRGMKDTQEPEPRPTLLGRLRHAIAGRA